MTDQLKRAISAAKIAQTNAEQAEATSIASSSAGDQNFDMSESSYKTSHTAVRKARRFAMQGLYEWLVTDHRFDIDGKLGWKANAPHDIAARTRATNAMHTVHIGYYHEMMHDIPEQIESLNILISQQLDREIDKLDTVEHAILLIGAYELQNRLEIPYKVVLDEAMKLNNHFGATDAHKLINAVLDKMAIELRDLEVQADTNAHLRTSQKVAAKQADAKQTESNESAAETDTGIDSTPTASTKPRISANNTSVKRNRPNKASAVKTNTKNDVQDPVKQDNVKAAPADTNNADEVNASVESIINETPVEENLVASNLISADVDTDTNPDIDNVETLPDSENSIAETAGSDESILDNADLTSVDSNSTEIDSVAKNNAEVAVDDTEPNSNEAKSQD